MDNRTKLATVMNGKLGYDSLFDPFTCADEDYEVLEWMRGMAKVNGVWSHTFKERQWMRAINATCKFSRDYRIGDFARAALKVIDPATNQTGLNDET